jgi:hypothetical protein
MAPRYLTGSNKFVPRLCISLAQPFSQRQTSSKFFMWVHLFSNRKQTMLHKFSVTGLSYFAIISATT